MGPHTNRTSKSIGLWGAALAGSLMALFWSAGAMAQGIPEPGIVLYGKVFENGALRQSGALTWTYTAPGGSRVVTATATLGAHVDQYGFTYSYRIHIPAEQGLPGHPASDNVLVVEAATTTYARAATVGATAATIVAPALTTDDFSVARKGSVQRVDLVLSGVIPTPTPTPTLTPSPTATPTGLPDTDGDGKPDNCEFIVPGPGQTSVIFPDSDADGLLDGQEDPGDCESVIGVLAMTDPRNRDTDGDGILDGIEVLILGTDPLDPDDPADATDSSGDGLPDSYAIDLGQDPNDIDWDGDGFTNAYELLMGSDPLDPNSRPSLGDASNDGITNNVDAMLIINFVLGNIGDPGGLDKADVRVDALVNNVDAMVLFNWFLGNVILIPVY